MEAKTVPGLYAIGEAVDVTGWLGGYNFQWAWASGWAAGISIPAALMLASAACPQGATTGGRHLLVGHRPAQMADGLGKGIEV